MSKNYYVYYRLKGKDWWKCERSCGTEWAAKERVKELKERKCYDEVIYQNELLEGAYY